jgi:CheY-like chemotaxis protein
MGRDLRPHHGHTLHLSLLHRASPVLRAGQPGPRRMLTMPSGRSQSTDSAPATPEGRGQLILVVDDQEDVRDLLATVLVNEGFRTLLAADGREALAIFTRHAAEISAVITDLHMPRSGGGSLADQLRKIRPEIPVLFISGMGDTASGPEASLPRQALPPGRPPRGRPPPAQAAPQVPQLRPAGKKPAPRLQGRRLRRPHARGRRKRRPYRALSSVLSPLSSPRPYSLA